MSIKQLQVKICCISSTEEAQVAIQHGATAIGLVGPMPSGPGVISLKEANEIGSVMPPEIDTFYLCSKTTFEEISAEYLIARTSTIQLVDKVSPDILEVLKKEFPKLKIVQVVHVQNESAIQEAKNLEPYIDRLLLDSGQPNKNVKVLGGTGQIHNWDISKEIVKQLNIPVYLAGGLKPENVIEAYHKVNPYGLDLCSGVRTDGNLDKEKLKDFFIKVNTLKEN